MTLPRPLRYLWAFPTTAFGLVLVGLGLATGGRAWVVKGVLEAHGGVIGFFLRRCTLLKGGASAMTLGHVVVGRSRQVLDDTRDHERVHVRQYERWGPFFVPAYVLASVVIWKRGGQAYLDNPFEREAYGRASG